MPFRYVGVSRRFPDSADDRGYRWGCSAIVRAPIRGCTPITPLIDVACRQAESTVTRRKLHDSDGLNLKVVPTDRHFWRFGSERGTYASRSLRARWASLRPDGAYSGWQSGLVASGKPRALSNAASSRGFLLIFLAVALVHR